MILTRFDRIVLDDLPVNIAEALERVLNDYNYLEDNPDYILINNFYEDENIYWQSHSACIYCYIILSGQEIITINDISDLDEVKKYDSKSDSALYRGKEQVRIRLKKDNIVVLYPEDAYKFHYIPGVPCRKVLVKIPFNL